MDTMLKVFLGSCIGLSVAVVLTERAAKALPMAPPDALPKPATPTAFSQAAQASAIAGALVSRSPSPPPNATVPPGDVVATFTPDLFVTKVPTTTAAGDVKPDTLLANVTLKGSFKDALGNINGSFGGGGAYPVLWVAPEGDRLAVQTGLNIAPGSDMVDNAVLIAHLA